MITEIRRIRTVSNVFIQLEFRTKKLAKNIEKRFESVALPLRSEAAEPVAKRLRVDDTG